MSDTEQLRAELNAVIDRYASESEITVCEAIGVLELVKAQLIDELKNKGTE